MRGAAEPFYGTCWNRNTLHTQPHAAALHFSSHITTSSIPVVSRRCRNQLVANVSLSCMGVMHPGFHTMPCPSNHSPSQHCRTQAPHTLFVSVQYTNPSVTVNHLMTPTHAAQRVAAQHSRAGHSSSYNFMPHLAIHQHSSCMH